MVKGSIVIPVFNEEVFIESFYKNLKINVDAVDAFEFVFVDDGSTDYSLKIMKKIAKENTNIKVVSLDKNYGKQVAISAGLKETEGDFVIICPINPFNSYLAINEAVSKWHEGYNIVRGIRNTAKSNNVLKKVKSYFFDSLTKFFRIDQKIYPKATVELYDRDVVDVLNTLEEKNMLLRSLNNWVDYEVYTFLYNPGTVNYISGKEFAKLEKGYNDLREKEKIKKQKVNKTRNYEPSLYASVTGLMLFAMSIILIAVLNATGVIPVTFNLFLWLLLFASLAASVLFGARAWMIKRVGIIPFVKKEDELYTVKEKIISK